MLSFYLGLRDDFTASEESGRWTNQVGGQFRGSGREQLTHHRHFRGVLQHATLGPFVPLTRLAHQNDGVCIG